MRHRNFLAILSLITGLLAGLGIAQPQNSAMAEPVDAYASVTEGINYQWVNDPLSQFMALTPGMVLHRINGSWFNAPDVPLEAQSWAEQGKSLFGPSTPIFVGNHTICTLAVTGLDAAGNKIGITAGHCGTTGDIVQSADTWRAGGRGVVVHQNQQLDYSIIRFDKNSVISNAYNGAVVTSLGGGVGDGAVVCKQGIATGRTCGPSLTTQGQTNWSHVCAMQGDSGAGLVDGGRLIGIVRGAMFSGMACSSPVQGIMFSPLMSTGIDTILADIATLPDGTPGRGFQLVDAPTAQ
ncbi:MAG: trypsin [Corynebacterium sp.]|nr:trypsin [Corynebacterium sp.]